MIEAFDWTFLDRLQTTHERSLLDEVYDLYESSFPDDSEREDKKQWERALHGDAGYVLAVLAVRSVSRLVGGIALEYYPASRTGLLTFVFVHPDYRSRGLARELIERACERLRVRGAVRVFAEAEDPKSVEEAGIETSIDPRLRLRILDRLGAKRVGIDYVQPSLGPGKNPAEHLMLLVMNDGEHVDRDLLIAFLTEFYSVLGLDNDQSEHLLRRAFAGSRQGAIPLIPLV